MIHFKTILVTGGAGFIGSSLCERLLEKGERVICLDNFDDFYAKTTKLKHLMVFLNHPHFKLVEGDIRNRSLLDALLRDFEVDIVVHLAAKAGVRGSIDAPLDYMDVNVTGTLQLLEAMKHRGIKNLIFASSSSVYGDRNGVFSETDSTDLPISPYAASKKTGELLNFHYYRNYDFKILNLRLFSIYGIRQRPDLVMHQFFNLITQQKPIKVYGLGDSRRDYTYITDVLRAIETAIGYLRQQPQSIYEILNIGNNQPVILRELIQLIEAIVGRKAIIEYHPLPAGDVFATCANIEKAKKWFNYQPKVSLLEGLTHFHDWFKGKK